ncbi:lysozyme [Desulfobulbus elongatus]|uniref:lysozyme n=1 Tax=Desulfobulbus elongatus TaxID=53332 RepID=UPI000484368B|nr:lysozyme [Desulfobulbus elongatus]
MRNLTPAIELIKHFEGIEDGDPTTVNLDPYMCPAGYWTIGWGHVVTNAKGRQLAGLRDRQQARAIYPAGITMAEAEALLADDVRRFAAGVERLVKVPINDNEFGALVSLAFNIGMGHFSGSSLLGLINKGALDWAPKEFLRWNKSGGRVLPGLQRRREAEVALWNA